MANEGASEAECADTGDDGDRIRAAVDRRQDPEKGVDQAECGADDTAMVVLAAREQSDGEARSNGDDEGKHYAESLGSKCRPRTPQEPVHVAMRWGIER